MAFLTKRANGMYSLSFWWKGKMYTKALGTDDEQVANEIKRDAEEQLANIRRGEFALASKLLADGHSIVDVLFGSKKIAHLINSLSDDNSLTLSELKTDFMDHLMARDRTAGHVECTRIHLDQFIRVLGDAKVISLTDAAMTAFKKSGQKRKPQASGRWNGVEVVGRIDCSKSW
ncbi:MAG: hypothetical protein DHS20C16_03910 [Phycisphaerae bacterium]|nr:MAG: hypothetical protein DHS20C16_03910 [Phycisphaerae bacterium]